MDLKFLDDMSWKEYQESLFMRDSATNTGVVLEGNVERERIENIVGWIGTNKKVLDLAGGFGAIADELRRNGNDVTMLDMPEVVAKAKVLFPELKYLEGSVLSIPSDEVFDVVLASEIVEHVLDLDQFFREIKRVLKKDGFLVITTPNMARPTNVFNLLMGNTQGWHYFDFDKKRCLDIIHIRYFTPITFGMTLEGFGFEVKDFRGGDTGGESYLWKKEFWNLKEEERNDLLDRFRLSYGERNAFMGLLEKYCPNEVWFKSLMCVKCEVKK